MTKSYLGEGTRSDGTANQLAAQIKSSPFYHRPASGLPARSRRTQGAAKSFTLGFAKNVEGPEEGVRAVRLRGREWFEAHSQC